MLYQKGASFSAKLANDDGKSAGKSPLAGYASQTSSPDGVANEDEDSGPESESYDYEEADDRNFETQEQLQQAQQLQEEKQKVNSNDYYISAESINFNSDSEDNFKAASTAPPAATPSTPNGRSTIRVATSTTTLRPPPASAGHDPDRNKDLEADYSNGDDYSYGYKSDMSVYDDVNNNQLNLRHPSSSRGSSSISESQTYQQTSNTNPENRSNAKSRKRNKNITSNKVQMHITRESTTLGNISEATEQDVGAAMATDR